MLRASSEEYDAGKEYEVKRLATSVCTFVYDRGRTISLLTQLGKRDSMQFLSTMPIDKDPPDARWGKPIFQTTIYGFKIGPEGPSYYPSFDRTPKNFRWLSFSEWWDEIILTAHQTQKPEMKLTRCELVMTLRNQDGGSHLDGEISNAAYLDFKAGGIGWIATRPDGTSGPIDPGPQLACMRQIAWELEQTIEAAINPG